MSTDITPDMIASELRSLMAPRVAAVNAERIARSIHDEEVAAARAHGAEAWCRACILPATVTRTEPGGETVALCRVHDMPCDDCGRYIGHDLSVEH